MGTIILIIVILAVVLGVLAVLRQAVLWYFKINELIKVLKQIEQNTRKNKE